MKFSVAGLTENPAGGISGEHGAIDPKIALECQYFFLDGIFELGLQTRRNHSEFYLTVEFCLSCGKSRGSCEFLDLKFATHILFAK